MPADVTGWDLLKTDYYNVVVKMSAACSPFCIYASDNNHLFTYIFLVHIVFNNISINLILDT